MFWSAFISSECNSWSGKFSSIYFDTIDNEFFQNHVEGNFDRIKVRIRWYNNSSFYKDKYILEIKRKINNTLKKYRKLLPVKNFEDLNSIDFYNQLIGIIYKKRKTRLFSI